MTGGEALHVVAGVLAGAEPGTLLAFRRAAGRHHAGAWEFPGGKVEAGESEPEALARELHEELGVQVRVGERLWEGFAPGPPAVRVCFFAVTVTAGELALSAHDAVQSVVPGESASLPWAPVDAAFVRWFGGRAPA